MSSETCALCRSPATKSRRLVKHHFQGRVAYPHSVMRVHEGSCHNFGDWVTTFYAEAGRVDELTEHIVIYLFNRAATIRLDGVIVLPIF